MAKESIKDKQYRERAERMSWADLAHLWQQIKTGQTVDWDSGKALEHFVIRAFQLSDLRVEYPYDVPPTGQRIEQIDGAVYDQSYIFLIECKDMQTVDIEVVAKMRNQLMRRPATTFGCIFVAGRFTQPALMLAGFAIPHRILLWSEKDIETALENQNFKSMLREKYEYLCLFGLSDQINNYREAYI
ncbi:MAG: hypothetical protein AAF639_21775 [Chloroflexota bacterium]